MSLQTVDISGNPALEKVLHVQLDKLLNACFAAMCCMTAEHRGTFAGDHTCSQLAEASHTRMPEPEDCSHMV
jgi:hypothetical protein